MSENDFTNRELAPSHPKQGRNLEKKWAEQIKGVRPFLIFSGILSAGLLPLVIYFISIRPVKKAYLEIQALRDEENAKELIKNLIDPPSSTYEMNKIPLSVAALQDLRSIEAGRTIHEYRKTLKSVITIGNGESLQQINIGLILTEALRNIAEANNYTLEQLENYYNKMPDTSLPAQGLRASIPITKVYFLDKPPLKAKNMVSGLPLDFSLDEIVACPYCGNMATKEDLEKWLIQNSNSSCPVCKAYLTIEDCPIVKIK
ncbi:MAG: hypothetical protein ACTSXO_00835 [Candidatus Heimdallarchaeota archaeon]